MKPRQRTCKIKAPGCEGKFLPLNSLQPCCLNPKCIIENKNQVQAKKHRRELKEFRQRNKSRAQWLKEAQAAFNKWVRVRDASRPCISCNLPANYKENRRGGIWDCGHYRSTGSCPELRFNPLNAHKQCVECNRHRSGNVVEYRINLLKRIGADNLDWLEGPHEPKKYTIEQLKEIKATYTRMAKELEAKAA